MNVIVAVSGGVDSVVLLDSLVNRRMGELITSLQLPVADYQLVVAHFDHGMRPDSAEDAAFVQSLAKQYGLQYESHRVELGVDASEDTARRARYEFLQSCSEKYQAVGIITAHHQDDVVESIIINILRGTGWRGLVPMDQISAKSQIIRPLLRIPKSQLYEYAKTHDLQWREDSTNNDSTYLRNYVRLQLLPQIIKKNPEANGQLLSAYTQTSKLKKEITKQLETYISDFQISGIEYQIPRYQLIMLPISAIREVIYYLLTQLDPDWHPTNQQILRAATFVKVGLPGKKMRISQSLEITSQKSLLQFKKY